MNRTAPPAALPHAHAGQARVAFLGTFHQACGVAAHTARMKDGLVAAARRRGLVLTRPRMVAQAADLTFAVTSAL